MSRTLTLKSIHVVTHDTNHLVFERPSDLTFTPGQAVDMALDREGWREERHPFTFTSLPDEETLEFVIKSYPEEADGHSGMTERVGQMQPGDTVLIEAPWGAIEDKGNGVFIAGGAGVTPFISILREKLRKGGDLSGNTLVFSNKTEADIILKEAFDGMPGLAIRYVVTDDETSAHYYPRIDVALLREHVTPGKDVCYICGPDAMLDDMARALREIGVAEEDIVTEEFD